MYNENDKAIYRKYCRTIYATIGSLFEKDVSHRNDKFIVNVLVKRSSFSFFFLEVMCRYLHFRKIVQSQQDAKT